MLKPVPAAETSRETPARSMIEYMEFAAGQFFEAEDGTVCAILSLWQGYVFHHWFFAGHWFGGGGYSERAFRATLIGRKARLIQSSTVCPA